MGRIEKTVFISYRRTNVPWALAIYQNLTMHGYDVFFDYQSIDSGNFEKVILENIKSRAHFLVVLTPSALERLKEPNDWLRREIETAMDEKRNIVPRMLESFDFGSPLTTQALTGKLAALKNYNGLRIYSEYFFEAMDKLRERYMNVEVSGVVSLNTEAKGITEIQKTAANEAPQVEKEQLTAQEWAERAYVFFEANNIDEAIRCYSEAIPLDPQDVYSLDLRGLAYVAKGDYEKAIADFGEAIRIKTDFVGAYQGRGIAREKKGDLEGAIQDFSEAIRLKPDDATVYCNLGSLLRSENLKRYEESEAAYHKAIEINPEDFDPHLALASINKQLGKGVSNEYIEKARQFLPEDDWYNRACLESVCDNFDLSFEYLQRAAQRKWFFPAWAWDDPDLQWIRDDPRFTEIVGPRQK